MPELVMERPKMSLQMHETLKNYILRERRRKKEEDVANEQKMREEMKKAEMTTQTLEQTKEQLRQLEAKLEELQQKKRDLFNQLKKVLNEETNLKKGTSSGMGSSSSNPTLNMTAVLIGGINQTQPNQGTSPSGGPNGQTNPVDTSISLIPYSHLSSGSSNGMNSQSSSIQQPPHPPQLISQPSSLSTLAQPTGLLPMVPQNSLLNSNGPSQSLTPGPSNSSITPVLVPGLTSNSTNSSIGSPNVNKSQSPFHPPQPMHPSHLAAVAAAAAAAAHSPNFQMMKYLQSNPGAIPPSISPQILPPPQGSSSHLLNSQSVVHGISPSSSPHILNSSSPRHHQLPIGVNSNNNSSSKRQRSPSPPLSIIQHINQQGVPMPPGQFLFNQNQMILQPSRSPANHMIPSSPPPSIMSQSYNSPSTNKKIRSNLPSNNSSNNLVGSQSPNPRHNNQTGHPNSSQQQQQQQHQQQQQQQQQQSSAFSSYLNSKVFQPLGPQQSSSNPSSKSSSGNNERNPSMSQQNQGYPNSNGSYGIPSRSLASSHSPIPPGPPGLFIGGHGQPPFVPGGPLPPQLNPAYLNPLTPEQQKLFYQQQQQQQQIMQHKMQMNAYAAHQNSQQGSNGNNGPNTGGGGSILTGFPIRSSNSSSNLHQQHPY